MERQQRGTAPVLWVLWMTYGSFYLCRTNIAAALPGIEAEFGFTKADLGWVLASLKLAYAAGQLINGQLAERFSPRLLLGIGMFVSAGLNVLFGFGTAIYFWLFVWACNGYSQALGWTPVMRVATNWIPAAKWGTQIGILGTSYQVIAAVTFVVAGFAAENIGWRGAFWLPAGLFALSGIHTLIFLREKPPEPVDIDEVAATPKQHSFKRNIRLVLGNRSLWLVAISLGLLNATRYGFLDWGLSHVKEVQGTGVAMAALKYAVLPLGGIGGAFLSGWVSDRWLDGRRAPVISTLLVALGLLTLVYGKVVHLGTAPLIITLALIGFAIYGAQVLLVGTFPVDLARPGTAAASVGFVNCMGYVGASASDILTGKLVVRYGWEVAVRWWAAYAIAAAIAIALLWNVRPKRAPTTA
jgi:OPA family glycerol-3-phosphate transporter-like MFS transporter